MWGWILAQSYILESLAICQVGWENILLKYKESELWKKVVGSKTKVGGNLPFSSKHFKSFFEIKIMMALNTKRILFLFTSGNTTRDI